MRKALNIEKQKFEQICSHVQAKKNFFMNFWSEQKAKLIFNKILSSYETFHRFFYESLTCAHIFIIRKIVESKKVIRSNFSSSRWRAEEKNMKLNKFSLSTRSLSATQKCLMEFHKTIPLKVMTWLLQMINGISMLLRELFVTQKLLSLNGKCSKWNFWWKTF